jgi:hypothetical protein
VATVFSTGVGFDDGTYLLPRVSQAGELLSQEGAIEEFLRTGQHLGIFDSPEASTAYGKRLSEAQGSRPPFTPEEARRRGIYQKLMRLGP